jgi:hypothetical protein
VKLFRAKARSAIHKSEGIRVEVSIFDKKYSHYSDIVIIVLEHFIEHEFPLFRVIFGGKDEHLLIKLSFFSTLL